MVYRYNDNFLHNLLLVEQNFSLQPKLNYGKYWQIQESYGLLKGLNLYYKQKQLYLLQRSFHRFFLRNYYKVYPGITQSFRIAIIFVL